jgi:hypothetical protein
MDADIRELIVVIDMARFLSFIVLAAKKGIESFIRHIRPNLFKA